MDIKKKKRKKNQIMNLKTGIIFMIDVFFSHLFQMATTTSPFFSLLLLLFFYSLSPLLFFFFFFSSWTTVHRLINCLLMMCSWSRKRLLALLLWRCVDNVAACIWSHRLVLRGVMLMLVMNKACCPIKDFKPCLWMS